MRSKGGFTVAWEHYNNVLCAGLQELQQRAEFVDMTIAADGHLVRVHQLVIGLASPFLKELIRSAPTPHPVLFLNNVSHNVLCCILEYMYTGEVVVPADDLKTFISTGKALHVRGLEEMVFEESSPATASKTASPEVMEAASTLENISSHQKTHPVPKNNISLPPYSPITTKYKNKSVPAPSFPRPSPSKRYAVYKCDSASEVAKDMPDLCGPSSKIQKLGVNVLETDKVESFDSDCDTAFEQHDDDTADDDEKYHVLSTLSSGDKNGNGSKQKPQLMYTVSNMGGLQLILNRYLYRMRFKLKDGRRRWQCVSAKSNCTASAMTLDDILISRTAMHNHPFHDRKIMAKVKAKMVYTSLENIPTR